MSVGGAEIDGKYPTFPLGLESELRIRSKTTQQE